MTAEWWPQSVRRAAALLVPAGASAAPSHRLVCSGSSLSRAVKEWAHQHQVRNQGKNCDSVDKNWRELVLAVNEKLLKRYWKSLSYKEKDEGIVKTNRDKQEIKMKIDEDTDWSYTPLQTPGKPSWFFKIVLEVISIHHWNIRCKMSRIKTFKRLKSFNGEQCFKLLQNMRSKWM